MKQEKKISLRLDGELVERPQDYAGRERVPVSHVLRHLVLRFLSDPSTEPHQAPPARRTVPDAALIARKQEDFRNEVCALFDGFRKQGYDQKESTKRANFALKDKRHPWATYEVIASVLRKTGRLRKAKIPDRGKTPDV